jgi:hypothetical protein
MFDIQTIYRVRNLGLPEAATRIPSTVDSSAVRREKVLFAYSIILSIQ